MSHNITVLICDDDPRVCDALVFVLEEQPDMVVVGVARDGDRAVELAREHRPAVAIVDVRMPNGGGEATRRILEQSPQTGVLAFSAYDENWAIDEMKSAGAGVYLVKGSPLDDILAAIRGLDGGIATED